MQKKFTPLLSLTLVLVLIFTACATSVQPDVAPGDTVLVSIDGSAADDFDMILSAQPIALEPGDSAFDLLLRTGVDVAYSTSTFGVFVTSIGGLEGGNNSGWMFYVNGEQPTVGSDSHTPGPGDEIVWLFMEF